RQRRLERDEYQVVDVLAEGLPTLLHHADHGEGQRAHGDLGTERVFPEPQLLDHTFADHRDTRPALDIEPAEESPTVDRVVVDLRPSLDDPEHHGAMLLVAVDHLLAAHQGRRDRHHTRNLLGDRLTVLPGQSNLARYDAGTLVAGVGHHHH